MTLSKSYKVIGVLHIFKKRGSVGGICLPLIWAWKECSKLVTVLPIVWVELFGNSWENDVTPTDEQEPKQPNSRNRPRCRLDSLPSGTKELPRARWEADNQVFPDFTSSITAVMHINVVGVALGGCSQANARSGKNYPSWTVLKGQW